MHRKSQNLHGTTGRTKLSTFVFVHSFLKLGQNRLTLPIKGFFLISSRIVHTNQMNMSSNAPELHRNAQSNWIKILGSGNVASVLNAAKGLKHPDLGFDIAYTQIPELAKLLGLGSLDR